MNQSCVGHLHETYTCKLTPLLRRCFVPVSGVLFAQILGGLRQNRDKSFARETALKIGASIGCCGAFIIRSPKDHYYHHCYYDDYYNHYHDYYEYYDDDHDYDDYYYYYYYYYFQAPKSRLRGLRLRGHGLEHGRDSS